MTPLGLTNTSLGIPSAAPPTVLGLQVEDALASARRLWVRGRLATMPGGDSRRATPRRWWRPWRRPAEPAAPPPTVHLETRVSGHAFTAEAALAPDGRFEALFTTELPPARRGWRMTRNLITYQGQTAEKCGLALTPPPEATAVLVVVLPLVYTHEPGGAQALVRSELAEQLTPVLRQLHQTPHNLAVYYLACVPPEDETRQSELALATTTLGWPAGHIVLQHGEAARAAQAMGVALDRLRWLFAESLELVVLNCDPSLASALAEHQEPRDDRAPVRHLLHGVAEARQLLAGQSRTQTPTASGVRRHRAGLVPRHPVVFCHGMLAFSTIHMQVPEELNCFWPLREFLRARGVRAFFPRVPATSGVVERAEDLRDQIRHWTEEPINLIAHSMGGLDARYLITHLGMADRVRSLTTVATPHRGTYLADWFIANYRNRVPLLLALEALGTNIEGFRDCRPVACTEFNSRTPDMPGVHYFSYGGEVSADRVTPVLRRARALLLQVEGPNDGMVSVASARWGEYLGTLHADHFAQTPDKAFVHPDEDFDTLGFYSRLIENLARRGF